MIEYYYNRIGQVPLVIKPEIFPNKNIFSILIGKNGTGKSTLLGSLCSELIKEMPRKKQNPIEFIFEANDFQSQSFFPDEIIAVSTSPFDKFPINRFNRHKNYSYLGLREMGFLSNVGIAYLSKVMGSLIDSISKNEKQANEICSVLEFLEFRDEINIILEFSLSEMQINEFLNITDIKRDFDNRTSMIFRRLNRSFFTNTDNSLNERKLRKLQSLILELLQDYSRNRRRVELVINKFGFENKINKTEIEDLLFLFNAGIVRLRDVLLTRVRNNERFSIKDASSGEQSIILAILGIASQIKDNCLILIDEPEICLHPQWQETYIEILTNTFDKYRNCHFIIATHSPLIVSKLNYCNSFIIDLEKNTITNAERSINNSVDFQLASIFKHPGFKNEYLSRIAINTFVRISKHKRLEDKDKENILILNEQLEYLKSNDPVLELIHTLLKLEEIYG